MYKYLDYLPEYIKSKEFKEFIALGVAVDLETTVADVLIRQVYENQFLNGADNTTISRWEKILGIIPTSSSNLHQRRMNVISRLNARAPFTVKSLKNIVEKMTGEECIIAVDYGNYDFDIIVDRKNTIPLNMKNLLEQIDIMKPANMTYSVKVKYINFIDFISAFSAKKTKMFFCNKLIASNAKLVVKDDMLKKYENNLVIKSKISTEVTKTFLCNKLVSSDLGYIITNANTKA